MNTHTVTLNFANPGDAAWFARCAADSVKIQDRLDPCRAGIMQDSLSKAFRVTRAVEEAEGAHSPMKAKTLEEILGKDELERRLRVAEDAEKQAELERESEIEAETEPTRPIRQPANT
jgi:hypothetical protein